MGDVDNTGSIIQDKTICHSYLDSITLLKTNWLTSADDLSQY